MRQAEQFVELVRDGMKGFRLTVENLAHKDEIRIEFWRDGMKQPRHIAATAFELMNDDIEKLAAVRIRNAHKIAENQAA